MYRRPPDPCLISRSNNTTCINKHAYLCIIDLGISPKIQSCSFIVTFEKEYDNSLSHYESFIFSTFSEK